MYTTEEVVKEIRSNCIHHTGEISKQLNDIKFSLENLKKDIERINDFKIEHKKAHEENNKVLTNYKVGVIVAILSAILSFIFNIFTTTK